MNARRTILRAAATALSAVFAVILMTAAPEALAGRAERVARRDDRVTTEGRIRDIRRDRDGYRVELDRGGEVFWVPERALRDRRSDLRVGVSIRLGGVFRNGIVIVDVVDWPLAPPPMQRRHDDLLRGWIERIDERADILVIREERGGRFVRADMRDALNWRRYERGDLRRGDFITLTGDWTRGGFDADRIESVRPRREGRRP